MKFIKKLYNFYKRKTGSINVTRIFKGKNGGHVTLFPGTIVTNSSFGGYNYIHNAQIGNSTIGSFTYIGMQTKISNTTIGNFCSVAGEVTIGLGIHPTNDFVSMHPTFYSTKNTGFPMALVKEQKLQVEGAHIEIGHDVWIGYRAIILDGVKIGHGAAIGAAAVVTKDVPPYAIVGGVPARVIKYRFSEDTIDRLLRLQWWNKSIEWIKSNAEHFDDVQYFLSKFDKNNDLE